MYVYWQRSVGSEVNEVTSVCYARDAVQTQTEMPGTQLCDCAWALEPEDQMGPEQGNSWVPGSRE